MFSKIFQRTRYNRQGFTLAEVLLTLTIIGVVAAMVVPSMMNNIKNTDLASKNTELRSLLMRAHLKLRADNGGTVDGLNYGKEMAKLLSTARDCINSPASGVCWYPANTAKIAQKDGTYKDLDWSTNQGLLLNNGMMLRLWSGTINCGTRTSTNSDPTACWPTVNYNSGYCTNFKVDLNGTRGPNIWGVDIREVNVFSDRIFVYGDKMPSRWSGVRNDALDPAEYQEGGSCYDTNSYSTDTFN